MALVLGYVNGVISNVNDPQKLGRAKIVIPGILEPTPYWCNPAGWPGAGQARRGSRYPIEVGQHVLVFFERGDSTAGASFLPGLYGVEDNVPTGPTYHSRMDDPNKRATIWEDDDLIVAVGIGRDAATQDPNVGSRYIAIGSKKDRTGQGGAMTGISIAVNTGPNGRSDVVSIHGRTTVFLKSDGYVKIDAPVVTINGRRVMTGGGSI